MPVPRSARSSVTRGPVLPRATLSARELAMESGREIIVRLTGGRRVEAELNRHHVLTDQPQSNGGEDTAPSPFQVFLASLGTCAGIFVQGFCAKRGIPYKDIRLIERPTYCSTGALESVEFELQLPPDFPANYQQALLRVVDQCSVKRVIESPPTFTSRVSQTLAGDGRHGAV